MCSLTTWKCFSFHRNVTYQTSITDTQGQNDSTEASPGPAELPGWRGHGDAGAGVTVTRTTAMLFFLEKGHKGWFLRLLKGEDAGWRSRHTSSRGCCPDPADHSRSRGSRSGAQARGRSSRVSALGKRPVATLHLPFGRFPSRMALQRPNAKTRNHTFLAGGTKHEAKMAAASRTRTWSFWEQGEGRGLRQRWEAAASFS